MHHQVAVRGIGRLIVMVCAIASVVLPVQAKPLKTFILSGQSNMDGYGNPEDLPEHLQPPLEDLPFFVDSEWGPMRVENNRHGVEISFARAMAEAWPDERIEIVKYAVGGTGLLAWDPYWTWDEAKQTADEQRGPLYHVWMSEVDLAHALSGEELEIAGMLWMQGESDALVEGPSEVYYENFKEFIETVRHDLGEPDLPFVFGRISQAAVWSHQENVRAAQAQAERDIPFVRMVSTDDLPFNDDRIHYNSQGLVTLGERFAEAFLETYETWQTVPKARRIFPFEHSVFFHSYAVGDRFPGTRIAIDLPVTALSDTIVRETVPPGWRAESLNPSAGAAQLEEGAIVWRLPGFSGEATLEYDLSVTTDTGNGTLFSGTLETADRLQSIGGLPQFHSQTGGLAEAPLLPNTVTLDGRIEPGEWAGAETFQITREDKVAPGVAVLGPLFPAEESNATVHVFHNEEFLNVAVDVVDPHLDFDSGRKTRLAVDGVALYLNPDLNTGNQKVTSSTIHAGAVGDGSAASGTLRPTSAPLPEGGYASEDGTVWNYGAHAKPDGTGYIVEFQFVKSEILDDPERKAIGFDIMIHDGYGTGQLLGKWSWHFIDDETGLAGYSTRDTDLWGTMQFLQGPSSVTEWPCY